MLYFAAKYDLGKLTAVLIESVWYHDDENAAMHGYAQIVETLLKGVACAGVRYKNGENSFMHCAAKNNLNYAAES